MQLAKRPSEPALSCGRNHKPMYGVKVCENTVAWQREGKLKRPVQPHLGGVCREREGKKRPEYFHWGQVTPMRSLTYKTRLRTHTDTKNEHLSTTQVHNTQSLEVLTTRGCNVSQSSDSKVKHTELLTGWIPAPPYSKWVSGNQHWGNIHNFLQLYFHFLSNIYQFKVISEVEHKNHRSSVKLTCSTPSWFCFYVCQFW